MPDFHQSRSLILAALTAASLVLLPRPAEALTHRDWMVVLVDSLGRSFGLPDEPKPEDYLNILQGKRNLHFEAEATRSEIDEVSTLAFFNYGPYSGTGWLLGSSQPTDVHLRFVLPLDGRYRVSMAARLPGHLVKIAGQTVVVDGSMEAFSKVEVGEFPLTAGPQEIVVTLPPGGALDYFELTAPNLPAIVPPGGWQPDAPLTWEALAATVVQALNLQTDLPPTDRSLSIEAESVAKPNGIRVVEDTHLGRPSGGRWLRTAVQSASVVVPLTIEQDGFYDLELAATGALVDVLINGHLSLTASGKSSLSPLRFPPVFLPRGGNTLTITVPPGGGLDRITLTARQSNLAALAAAAGITPSGDAPTSVDLDRLSTRLTSATH